MKKNVTYGSHLKIKKKQTNKYQKRKGSLPREREKQSERKDFFYFFSSLTSLFDIRKSDRQNSSGQEAK